MGFCVTRSCGWCGTCALWGFGRWSCEEILREEWGVVDLGEYDEEREVRISSIL